MKIIYASGQAVAIDDRDLARVARYHWCISNGYVVGRVAGRSITLQEFIMGKQQGCIVDHRDDDKLDNRRKNLRHITQSHNVRRSPKHTGYYWSEPNMKWRVQITINNKQHHLGYYTTEQQARRAYLNARKKLINE
jgi:hypothetical protein